VVKNAFFLKKKNMKCKMCNSENTKLYNLVSYEPIKGITYHCVNYCFNCKKHYFLKREFCENCDEWIESKTLKKKEENYTKPLL